MDKMTDKNESTKMQKDLMESTAYITAHEDVELLNRPELRPVRLQLEMLKPELALREENIVSTIAVFGSARTPSPEQALSERDAALKLLEAGPEDANAKAALARAEKRVEQSRYYEIAREFSRIVSSSCQLNGFREYVVVTGGGPGIMEAANRGAHDVGAKSIGLNISLPFEQTPNAYITPELCFNFRYFAIRKIHFLLRAKALVALPGGFGTLDELFETLTLVQTNKVFRVPIVLVGRRFWDKIVSFPALVEEGVICAEDINLFSYAEEAGEIWEAISKYYSEHPMEQEPDHCI